MLYDFQVQELLAKWLAAALYEAEVLEFESGVLTVGHLRAYSGKFETYCPDCKKDSLFKVNGQAGSASVGDDEKRIAALKAVRPLDVRSFQNDIEKKWFGPFEIAMTCSRVESHVVRLYMLYDRTDGKYIKPAEDGEFGHIEWTRELVKVGQWPSLVEFQQHEIDEFKGVFDQLTLKEWKRALITKAHGFHVAACVHLRRVFERILGEARDQIDSGKYKGSSWPEYDGGRMTDRIKLVRSELPPFIGEHPELYAVLSTGVHQLSEEECARELPMLLRCIRLIAEQRLEERKRRKNEEEIKSLLRESASRLGQRPTSDD